MPYVEFDMRKCESGKGKNFFDEFPNIRVHKGVVETSRGRRAKNHVYRRCIVRLQL